MGSNKPSNACANRVGVSQEEEHVFLSVPNKLPRILTSEDRLADLAQETPTAWIARPLMGYQAKDYVLRGNPA
jgi:hypothetical protein